MNDTAGRPTTGQAEEHADSAAAPSSSKSLERIMMDILLRTWNLERIVTSCHPPSLWMGGDAALTTVVVNAIARRTGINLGSASMSQVQAVVSELSEWDLHSFAAVAADASADACLAEIGRLEIRLR